MQVEILAYTVCPEGPDHPEYVIHTVYPKYSGTPKYWTMLANFVLLAQSNKQVTSTPSIRGVHNQGICCANALLQSVRQ